MICVHYITARRKELQWHKGQTIRLSGTLPLERLSPQIIIEINFQVIVHGPQAHKYVSINSEESLFGDIKGVYKSTNKKGVYDFYRPIITFILHILYFGKCGTMSSWFELCMKLCLVGLNYV